MELEKQVVSLELAKRLKELGVKQESQFFWSYNDTGFAVEYRAFVKNRNGAELECYSAFTVAELGEMLPVGYYSRHGANGYSCGTNKSPQHFTTKADTEADARAKMLVYLLENKLIEV
jgi:hypothetical protein